MPNCKVNSLITFFRFNTYPFLHLIDICAAHFKRFWNIAVCLFSDCFIKRFTKRATANKLRIYENIFHHLSPTRFVIFCILCIFKPSAFTAECIQWHDSEEKLETLEQREYIRHFILGAVIRHRTIISDVKIQRTSLILRWGACLKRSGNIQLLLYSENYRSS